MWKLIAIALIVLYVIRKILRLLTPAVVEQADVVELKACAYCDTLVRVDKGMTSRGFFFCDGDHARRYFDQGGKPRV